MLCMIYSDFLMSVVTSVQLMWDESKSAQFLCQSASFAVHANVRIKVQDEIYQELDGPPSLEGHIARPCAADLPAEVAGPARASSVR